MKKERMKRTAVLIPRDVLTEVEAMSQGRTLSEMIRLALVEMIKKEKREAQK